VSVVVSVSVDASDVSVSACDEEGMPVELSLETRQGVGTLRRIPLTKGRGILPAA